jgi:hypothetical protein
MTADGYARLRHVPRVHAGLVVDGDPLTHATSPTGERTALCGAIGEVVRHLFEDVPRRSTCADCQAHSDAVRASDLLGAVVGAADRAHLELTPEVLAAVRIVEVALLATYPEDPSRPNFDVS